MNDHLDEQFDALVESYVETCWMCPTQYEGKLKDGQSFYFRYRWGHASLGIGNTVDDAISDSFKTDLQLGDSLDGYMDFLEFKNAMIMLLQLKGIRA